MANASLSVEEDGVDRPLVATHERTAQASVSGDATRVSITPPPGVRVTVDRGDAILFIVPNAASVDLTVSWRQPADPDDSENTSRCSASRVFTLPILAAARARAYRQPGAQREFITFAVAPVANRPNLSPLAISIRSTRQVRFPRATERLRTMTVPMLVGEQVRYEKRLPSLVHITTAAKCRFWWLTCGSAMAHVDQLTVNSRGRPDLDGSNSVLRALARSQPARYAARFGLLVTAFPGPARNQPFGYDVQVHQDGVLLARVRRAGRCVDARTNAGIVKRCTVARKSTLLR